MKSDDAIHPLQEARLGIPPRVQNFVIGENMDPTHADLRTPAEERKFGSGWISGVLALGLAVIGLGTVLCLRYPQLLTVADARAMYNVGLIRLALQAVLVTGFVLGIS